MGKKKKKKSPKAWCYYCSREFEDEKILVQHQKAKHFKCNFCHKKLSTAGGLVIHVLQVHKETITKVPNAKPDRESTEIEIFGMEGIPPEILAVHDEEDEDERPSKVIKDEFSVSRLGNMVMGSNLGMAPPQPLYSQVRPNRFMPPPSVVQPPVWTPPQLPFSRPWSCAPPSQPPVMQPPRPLFPIQGIRPPPNAPNVLSILSQPPSQSSFPIPHVHVPPAPPPQPLFPVNGPATVSPVPASTPSVPQPLYPTSLTRPPLEMKSDNDDGLPLGSTSHVSYPNPFLMATMKPQNSSSFGGAQIYASGPQTGGPPIGPPPVIANKVPAHGRANEVYLLWDDDAMSMEECRISLPEYQVHNKAYEVKSRAELLAWLFIFIKMGERIYPTKLGVQQPFQVENIPLNCNPRYIYSLIISIKLPLKVKLSLCYTCSRS